MLHEQMLCGRELHVSTESMALKRQCQPPNKQLNLKFPVLYRRRLADEHVERESKGRIDAYKGTFRHANSYQGSVQQALTARAGPGARLSKLEWT